MAKSFIVEGSPEWESICQQCGICCLEKCVCGTGDMFLTNIRCSSLDKNTHKCKCYSLDKQSRNNGRDDCIAITRKLLNNNYLVPSFCPYAQKFCKNPAIKNAPKQRPVIDWENTVSETEVGDESVFLHIIPESQEYFKYNPQVNQRIRENMARLR